MRIFALTLIIILFSGLFSALLNQAHDIANDVPEGKLASLSFSPFRKHQSPLEEIFPSTEEIDEDLQLMAGITHSIRTYSSAMGLSSISSQAEKHGLTMTQGAWLGYGKKDNDREIAALIQSANQYPDVVKRVIVGNEILLRGEMEAEELIEYIRRVKSAIKQPVSYADVWSMYMKHPQLIKEVDFITIHILPYWEDEPISIDRAAQHIEHAFKLVQEKVKELGQAKPILIGETGWPSQGRQRAQAVPGVVNQADFIRQLVHTADKNGFDYNIIEAFNQPWKARQEGVVGGQWGLYSADRQAVFPLTGPVYENPDWYWRWLVATLIVLALVMLAYKRLSELNTVSLVVYLGFLQLLGLLLVIAMATLWSVSHEVSQQLETLFLALISASMAALLLRQAYGILSGSQVADKSAALLYFLYVLIAGVALYKTYGLATHGRYLSFPLELAAIPVTGLLGLFIMRCMADKRFSLSNIASSRLLAPSAVYPVWDKLIGFALAYISLRLLYGETRAFMYGRDFVAAYPQLPEQIKMAVFLTLSNQQLLLWLFCLGVLTTSFLAAKSKKADGAIK